MKSVELGQLTMTRHIKDIIADNEQFATDVTKALMRYMNADWGEMSKSDLDKNQYALATGDDRLFASYQTCMSKIWIITEHDRSVTTILFPDEY